MIKFDSFILDNLKLLYYLRFLLNIDGGFIIEPYFMTTGQMIVELTILKAFAPEENRPHVSFIRGSILVASILDVEKNVTSIPKL